MRAAGSCILVFLFAAGAGCSSSGEDYVVRADAAPVVPADQARPAGYSSIYTTPYYGGYRPYYTYGLADNRFYSSRPYYYRDDYPTPRLYRNPGHRPFARYTDRPYDRYPFDDGRYYRRFSERYGDRYDRRFSERHYRGSYDRARDNARRSTYAPPSDRFRFRGDHFRGTGPGGGGGGVSSHGRR